MAAIAEVGGRSGAESICNEYIIEIVIDIGIAIGIQAVNTICTALHRYKIVVYHACRGRCICVAQS